MEHTGRIELEAERVHGFCAAEVRADGLVTRYTTVGAGAPVVLLGGAFLPADAVNALASRFRLVMPEVPPEVERAGRPRSGWLRGFLDGLGLGEVALVAGPAQGLAALTFAMLEVGRVARLVLLVTDGSDPQAPAGVIRDDLAGTAQPLLLVRVDAADGAAPAAVADDVARFLEGEAG